jgi:hypothetical protein
VLNWLSSRNSGLATLANEVLSALSVNWNTPCPPPTTVADD